MNLRPGYITFGKEMAQVSSLPGGQSSLCLARGERLIWLITIGNCMKREDSIRDYKALCTGSHPEYHTPQTLDALQNYRDQGGRLVYLGGNGFYWKIALSPEDPELIEIRRGESGIRAWAAGRARPLFL